MEPVQGADTIRTNLWSKLTGVPSWKVLLPMMTHLGPMMTHLGPLERQAYPDGLN